MPMEVATEGGIPNDANNDIETGIGAGTLLPPLLLLLLPVLVVVVGGG